MLQTNEGAFQYEHTLDHFVEYFFKAGSVFDSPKRSSFYPGEESALSLFEKIWLSYVWCGQGVRLPGRPWRPPGSR